MANRLKMLLTNKGSSNSILNIGLEIFYIVKRQDMVTDDILNEIKERLVNGFNPDQIILFGSQARGTANQKSDIDILVICSIKGSRRDLTLDMYRALENIGIAKDIVVLTKEEFERNRKIPGTVARPAWLEGRILYERS